MLCLFNRYTSYALEGVSYFTEMQNQYTGQVPLFEGASDPVDFKSIYKLRNVYYKTETFIKYHKKTKLPKRKTITTEISEHEYNKNTK